MKYNIAAYTGGDIQIQVRDILRIYLKIRRNHPFRLLVLSPYIHVNIVLYDFVSNNSFSNFIADDIRFVFVAGNIQFVFVAGDIQLVFCRR